MTLQLVEAARILQLDPAQGWPQTITPERLGALQAWRKGLDTKTLRIDTRNWSKAIELALVAGGIEHTTTTERVQVVEQQDHELFAPIPLASDEWLGRDFGRNSERTTQAAHKTVTHHHITAPAFAVWLAAQGEEPSAHIAAWFKATGVTVATPPVPVTKTAAPAPVVASASSPQDPERRLARLRALGGSATYTDAAWRIKGIGELVASEKAEVRRRSDEKTIRADLKEAAQNEREEKRASAFSGLGGR